MAGVADARAARRRAEILDAARTVFLGSGYAGASMDEVAALAATSKRTVYGLFRDKAGLFTAVITEDIRAAERRSQDVIEALESTQDIEADLRAFARLHLEIVTQPPMMRLRRLVIGEAERFPELARAWYAGGPGRGQATLARVFAALADRGVLTVDDPPLAAQNFNWLVLSIPLNNAMFHPDDRPGTGELHRYADEATRVFLAAYGRRRRTGRTPSS